MLMTLVFTFVIVVFVFLVGIFGLSYYDHIIGNILNVVNLTVSNSANPNRSLFMARMLVLLNNSSGTTAGKRDQYQ